MNPAEFEEFLKEHEKDIYSFCLYLTGDRFLADDLYQDTALQAFIYAEKIDAGNNPKSFLLSIAAGKWKNHKRKAARRNHIAPSASIDDMENSFIFDIPDRETVEGEADKREMRYIINKILLEIDEKFKVPLILFYFNGCQEKEVAKICKIPLGTIKSRIHKGKKLLKETLQKEGYNYE